MVPSGRNIHASSVGSLPCGTLIRRYGSRSGGWPAVTSWNTGSDTATAMLAFECSSRTRRNGGASTRRVTVAVAWPVKPSLVPATSPSWTATRSRSRASSVFAGRWGQPIRPDNLTDRFNQLAVAAKVRPIGPHQIRHLIASTLLDAGYGVHEVAERLGHDPAALMRYYTRVSAVRRLQATDRIAELMPAPEIQPRALRNWPGCTTSLLTEAGTSAELRTG